MDFSSELNTPITANTLELPRAWDTTLARCISDLFSPPLLAITGILLAAWQLKSASAWVWGIYFILMTVALPVGYVLWKVRCGEISDFHIYRREQRIKPMLITLRWKISGHGTAIASLVVFLIGLFGSLAAPLLLMIPLVAWARVRLNRHDLAQTTAGALVGAAFMSSLLYLAAFTCQGAEILCR